MVAKTNTADDHQRESENDVDHVVRGAGHVLSLTHADEVNEFLRTHMRRHAEPAAEAGAMI